MREIKFRGKAVDTGQWVHGSYVDGFIVDGVVEANDEYIVIERWQKVDPETVGQYTGLKDKNGVEIYEGDICIDSGCWVFTVVWDEDNARFIGKQIKPRGETYICYISRVPAVKVIGNIHDNPELLAGE